MSPRAAPTAGHPEILRAGLEELVLALSFAHEVRLLDRVARAIVNRACGTLAANELFTAPPLLRSRAVIAAEVELKLAAEARSLLERAVETAPRPLGVAVAQPPLPSFVDAARAIARIAARPSLVYLFAAIITETLACHRLSVAASDPSLDPLVAGHLARRAEVERGHAAIFSDVCRIAWASLDATDQRAVLTFTPRLLDCYVIPSRTNSLAILDDAGVDPEAAERICRQTYGGPAMARIIGPQVSRALKVFGRAGLLDSAEGRRAFGGYVRTPLP